MESLWIENRRNAIGIETVSRFFVDPLSKSACLGLVRAVEIVIAFSRDSLLKGTAYGATGIGALHGHPRKLKRAGRDFSLARGVFRSLNGQKMKALRANRRDAARGAAGESERGAGWNNWSATTGQNR